MVTSTLKHDHKKESTFRTNGAEPKINLQIFPPSMITMPHRFSCEILTNYLVKQMYVICQQKIYPLESSLKLKYASVDIFLNDM